MDVPGVIPEGDEHRRFMAKHQQKEQNYKICGNNSPPRLVKPCLTNQHHDSTFQCLPCLHHPFGAITYHTLFWFAAPPQQQLRLQC